MATKFKRVAGMQPVPKLTGTIKGETFTVVLDDISIGDKWSALVLPKLQKDGLGHVILKEGQTSFEFKDGYKSTVHFMASTGNLEVKGFEIYSETTEADASDESEEAQE